MNDWTPHADAVVRAVPEDEAIRAIRDKLEARYRTLIKRLRDAGDETWADNIASWNSLREEPFRCGLALMEVMVEEIHSLRGHKITIEAAAVEAKRTGQPFVFVSSAKLAEAETREENERLQQLVTDAHATNTHMRAQLEQQESVNAGLRRAYEHACEQRDKYQQRTAEWRQAATDGTAITIACTGCANGCMACDPMEGRNHV
jgi:hypothetical protein